MGSYYHGRFVFGNHLIEELFWCGPLIYHYDIFRVAFLLVRILLSRRFLVAAFLFLSLREPSTPFLFGAVDGVRIVVTSDLG